MNPEIRVATAADRGAIVASLVAAFVEDPVLRYLFPDDAGYPPGATAFFGHLFDRRVTLGTVWTVGHGASSALWEPPAGGDPSVPDDVPDQLPDDALARMKAYDEAVHTALPTEPHWYLGVLGTHPDHAGQGLGRAVMQPGLARAAADGLPAYLETSKPGNVSIYEKTGWRMVTEVLSPVPTWIMTQ